MNHLGLFQGHGIELEYMIVDAETLDPLPIADALLKDATGHLTSDFEDGDISWSNELVLHVIELKTTRPESKLDQLEKSFLRSQARIRSLLAKRNARLMPTAMHPWFNPANKRLWPHDNNEIYATYDRIFGCEGHGWSNLQSMHINLPFKDDTEFEKLHTAIRFILPLLPALAASSPIYDGCTSGFCDSRMKFYQQNQARVPSIAGHIIPEPVSSMADYQEKILARIYRDIAPHDPEGLLQEDWLNSRGAIARFERQTIEIRVLDIQENPSIDLAIADFICATLKRLISGEWISHEAQLQTPTENLKKTFDACIQSAENATISDRDYLKSWQINASSPMTAREFWRQVHTEIGGSIEKNHHEIISRLIEEGSLASRISRALGPSPDRAKISQIYRTLCDNLDRAEFFTPR